MAAALWYDLRHALRHLRRTPCFSFVVVLTLALGIGANTALYTLLNVMVLRKLPVPAADRLVAISLLDQSGAQMRGMFYSTFLELRERQRSFETLFAYSGGRGVSVEVNGDTTQAGLEGGTLEYYSVLGVKPLLGRVISAEDIPSIGQPAPVAVIGHRFWQSVLGGDRGAIGKKITADGTPLTVIGVLPREFRGMQADYGSDLFVPLPLVRWIGATTGEKKRPIGAHYAIGRLRKGVTIAQARAEIDVLWPSIRSGSLPPGATPLEQAEIRKQRVRVESAATGFASVLRGRYGDPLYVLTLLTVLLLGIACVNLSGLLLARATARSQQLAICLSLGASRARLVQQLVIESLLLSAAGSFAALPLAWWVSRLLVVALWGPEAASRAPSVAPDARLLLALVTAALGTGVAVGALPAWAASRARPSLGLQHGRTVTTSTGRWGKTVLVIQVALSVVLLFGAGLFARSLANLRALDLGFKTDRLVWTRVGSQPRGYERIDEASYYPEMVRQISALPGVESVGLSRLFPTYFSFNRAALLQPVAATGVIGTPEVATFQEAISPGFFQTLRVPFLGGRDFTWLDTMQSPAIAIVNRSLARRLFPGGDALGKHIRVGADPKLRAVGIVGVVGDGSYGNLRESHVPAVFRPILQDVVRIPIVNIRTAASPADLLEPLRRTVAALGHEQVRTLYTLGGKVDESIIHERLLCAASLVFGSLALLLAFIGLYALLAYAVARRTREVGVRIALGASRTQVISMVVCDGLALTLFGIALGVPCAVGAGRVTGTLLFGVRPTDLVSLSLASVFLVLVAAAASFIPARRASGIDPMAALRCE